MAIKGKNNGADIDIAATPDKALLVQAITEEEIEHAAGKGDAFSFHVTEAAIDTTDTVLFVRNDDDALLVLDRCTLNGDVAEIMNWQICLGSATTTPAGGSVITPMNLYQSFSGKSYAHTARTDETDVAQGTCIYEEKVQVLQGAAHVPLHGIILGKGQYVQFDIVGTTPVVGMTLWGHWQTEIG